MTPMFQPKHTLRSVAEDLAAGLATGNVVLPLDVAETPPRVELPRRIAGGWFVAWLVRSIHRRTRVEQRV